MKDVLYGFGHDPIGNLLHSIGPLIFEYIPLGQFKQFGDPSLE